jgi:hypothetical protein
MIHRGTHEPKKNPEARPRTHGTNAMLEKKGVTQQPKTTAIAARSGTITFRALPVLETVLMVLCSARISHTPYAIVAAQIATKVAVIEVPIIRMASVPFWSFPKYGPPKQIHSPVPIPYPTSTLHLVSRRVHWLAFVGSKE